MEEQTSEEEQARVAALERMIAEEARTRVGDAGDEVPETDDYADNWHFKIRLQVKQTLSMRVKVMNLTRII